MDPSRVTARAKSQPDERGRRGPHAVRARLSYETRLAGRRARSARLRLSYEAHRRLLANRSSGRRFAANPPALSDAQRQVLGDLRDNGIAITRFDELFGGTPLWDEQRREMDSFVREAESERGGQSRDDGPANKEGYLIRRMQQLAMVDQRRVPAPG